MGLGHLFWATRLQSRQPQQQLSHCRNSVDITDLCRVVKNVSSLFPCEFFPYLLLSLKSQRYSLLVAFGPFFVVGGGVEICGLVLKGIETERDISCP